MSFADKIFTWLNKILSFLGELFSGLFELIANAVNTILDIIVKPLSYLYYFLEGIFYFFMKVFDIVVMIVKIFVASFQFLGSLIMGVFRTIRLWLTVDLSTNTNFVSASGTGFQTVMDIIRPTGLLTVVPVIAIAFLWFFFVLKMIGLFGGNISIAPFGRSADK